MNLTLASGRHTIAVYAKSTVSLGYNSATVFPVDVNTGPTVAMTAPASGFVFQAGQTVTLTAAAAYGTFAITARATDARGGVSVSAQQQVRCPSRRSGAGAARRYRWLIVSRWPGPRRRTRCGRPTSCSSARPMRRSSRRAYNEERPKKRLGRG